MYGTLAYALAFILYMFGGCSTMYDPVLEMLTVEEFGERQKNDEQSYLAYDFVEFNATTFEYSIARDDKYSEIWADPIYVFFNNYTMVRVEYLSLMSPVEVEYNETDQTLIFNVIKPFVRIPFAVAGYSKINLTKIHHA